LKFVWKLKNWYFFQVFSLHEILLLAGG
jgi:hypothetical protein